MSGTGSLVTRKYAGFRGVDFRGEEINLTRSPDALNMWKDYKETDSIRTRPAMALKTEFPAAVYGIYFFDGLMLVHSGKNIYTVTSGGKKTIIFSDANERRSNAFVYDGVWYFQDGKNYLQYDGSTIGEVVGFVPTTRIAGKPAGGGTTYQDVNMLTGRRINTFLADGETPDYYLDAINIDSDFVPVVKVDGVVQGTDTYTVDYAAGKISFKAAPMPPLTDGQDNVSIEFSKTVSKYRDRILNCTMLQVFDNRVFFSGNPNYPNYVWHSSLNNPTYFSDLDYYEEGMDDAPVRGMVAGNNALWVFREPSDANTNVFYHTPTTDDEYGKVYPSVHSSITTGCVGAAVNFGDDICFFSDRGMEGMHGDVTTEQAVAHRSSLIDRKLTAEAGYRDMILTEWEGYLLVFIGDKAYLADSRTAFGYENHIEYDWYYWEMEHPITSARVYDNTLYLGTDNGVYTLTDNESPVESYWTTPKDRFGYPHLQKTTNKRGCVIEATGDFFISVRTDKNGEFMRVSEAAGITDYAVARIKQKKFKDIQLKFYSPTRFSLEAASLECWVGGYIKR